jgi:hypothetical protein
VSDIRESAMKQAIERAAAAEAKLAKIRELHSPVVTNEDYPGLKPWCDACGDYSPCETAQTLDGTA